MNYKPGFFYLIFVTISIALLFYLNIKKSATLPVAADADSLMVKSQVIRINTNVKRSVYLFRFLQDQYDIWETTMEYSYIYLIAPLH